MTGISEGEKLICNIKSYLLFKCENYMQYITKVLKLEKEAPIYVHCLQTDYFINTNAESLFFLFGKIIILSKQ